MAETQARYIYQNSGLDLRRFAHVQLSYSPFDYSRKRIKQTAPDNYVLACRTWRILTYYLEHKKLFEVRSIQSAYSEQELLVGVEDKYEDKELHRRFQKQFG